MEVIIDVSRERCANSRNLFEIGDAGPHYTLQSTEVGKQCAAARGAEARHGFQHGLVVTFRSLATVTGDGETMCFVADALHEA